MTDFNQMSKAELRAYVLAHRGDSTAFSTLVDRLKADSSNQVWHPCPNTPDDWAKVSALIEAQLKSRQICKLK